MKVPDDWDGPWWTAPEVVLAAITAVICAAVILWVALRRGIL